MTTNITDLLYKKVYRKLQKQMKNDDSFRNEINELLFFYGHKLMTFAKNAENENLITEKLEDVITSQYFQGYYVMKTILEDEENQFDSEWSLSLGMVRNEIPNFLKTAFEDEEGSLDWTYTEIGHKFSMEVLQVMEMGFDITKQIRIDMANYGAYKAFIEDDSYTANDQLPPTSMLLGNPFDLEFLSPQVYMQAEFSTTENEVWDLYTWSSVQNGGWSGSVHLSQMTTSEQTFYLLEIKIINLITREEISGLINNIINRIPIEIRQLLQTRLYHVEEIEIIVPAETPNE